MHSQKDNHAVNDALKPINAATPQSGAGAFELSAEERDAIEHEKHHYEDPRAASIEALKIVQKKRGWVPDGAIYAIALRHSCQRCRRRGHIL